MRRCNLFDVKLKGKRANLLPVMFFVHGGAFYAGTQIKMGPERLGDVADIVLVQIL
jgi:carboxylesterase type B